jgi:hypothetical protein
MNALPQSYRLWEPPVPHRLDEVTGQAVDMHSAHVFLQRLSTLSAEPPRDHVLMEALGIAALIRYCRCFTSGSRSKLIIDDLASATSEEIELHDYLRGVRDWHIAHPVNKQEVHAVHLIVNASTSGQPELLGLSSFSSVALPLDSKQIELALSITKKWISLLSQRLVDEQLRLQPHAQALSPSQLAALPEKDPAPDRNVQARRRRERPK